LENHDISIVIKILVASGELGLLELTNYIQSFLIKRKQTWIEKNIDLLYKTSFENDSFLELQNFCNNLILRDPDKLFKSSNFPSIPEKLLLLLLKSDNNHQTKEIQIWENVLKWGIVNNNDELPNNIKDFSKDNFNSLKNTLQQFIPLIKFYNLNSKEFLDKVYPYKKILPKELRENLIKHFLSPNGNNNDNNNLNHDHNQILNKQQQQQQSYSINKEINTTTISKEFIDSKIITLKHAELISSWIDSDKLTTTTHYFKLLIRGSRDGFSPKKFHEICDNQPNTVTIIKVKYKNEILGGYNQIPWNSDLMMLNDDSSTTTKNNFIFSFKNKDNHDDDDILKNYILSRVKNEKQAINNWFIHGPSFGDGDLTLSGDKYYNDNYCKKSSYEKSIRETESKFSVEEYEVFKVLFNEKIV
jgi:hypothetical protein